MTEISNQSLDLAILANFVHQVINPLNGVSGTLDNLADGTISQARSKQRLQAARAQLEQAIVLVRNLAYFSEMSAWSDGVLPPNHAKNVCTLPEIIIQAAMYFQELGAAKHIDIVLENPKDQFKVEGNPDLLRQVFMNLFDNAVKYGQRNSLVSIQTWKQKKTGALLVKVSGRSIFIPANERERIFQLGFRSQNAKNQLASGSGLGLYICRRILKLFDNATIAVESSSPVGDVTFLLRFPVSVERDSFL
jgi:signal transduction histidine kinase